MLPCILSIITVADSANADARQLRFADADPKFQDSHISDTVAVIVCHVHVPL